MTDNTWKVESSAERKIVLALASFSGGDDTGGNSPSTRDNDETELCMKESIDLSASYWCCKPHAPQSGAGVCCFLRLTNRLFPSPEWSQYPKCSWEPSHCLSHFDVRKNAANQVDELKIDLVKSEYDGIVWRAPASSSWPLRLLLSWRGYFWEGAVSLSFLSHLHSKP